MSGGVAAVWQTGCGGCSSGATAEQPGARIAGTDCVEGSGRRWPGRVRCGADDFEERQA